MNFTVFSTETTNIFPVANSSLGGQLCSEFNLRSRESVCTDPSVPYMIGPSYTHSLNDFLISQDVDDGGVIRSSTILRVSAGRALVNGHYVESLVPVEVDLQDANTYIAQDSQTRGPTLAGNLCIGLKAVYSTDQTLANTLTAENDGLYRGIQLVILPKSEFELPSANISPDNVTAHLKLGEVEFRDNVILSVTPNLDRIQVMTADRIGNTERLLSGEYVKKTGLQPKKLYAFSGKSDHESTPQAPWEDTWCDATDSLMIWDNNPELVDAPSGTPDTVEEARFITTQTGKTYLQIPHKQPEGMTSTSGVPQYYKDKLLEIPGASYALSTGGVVTPTYTRNIKKLQEELDRSKYLLVGHQLRYLSLYDPDAGDELPPINSQWAPGDYILVGEDHSIAVQDGSYPSTIYVVLPGVVQAFAHVTQLPGGVQLSYESYASFSDDTCDPSNPSTWATALAVSAAKNMVRGVSGQDYITVFNEDASGDTPYYFKVTSSKLEGPEGPTYSPPVRVTASVSLATQTTVGGFYNVSETDLGQGYVMLDENGFLKLLDFDLLMQGVLNYQLGADFSTSRGADAATIQSQLDDYVNSRVAFPSAQHLSTSNTPYQIIVTIDLTEDDAEQVITIQNIDSRFNTPVLINFEGTANSNLTVNIVDCEKIQLRIPDSVQDAKFNLYRCGLYYDHDILNKLNIIEGMTLWYERRSAEEPNLVVDDMTVTAVGQPQASASVEYWTPSSPNDNHYLYSLRSLTFAGTGDIIGCELYVTDNWTSNVSLGKYVSVFKFTLPQSSSGLSYPSKRLTRQLKVTGQFITAYPLSTSTPSGYMIKNTSFTALSNKSTTDDNMVTTLTEGVISFYTEVDEISAVYGIDSTQPVDSWETQKFHIFAGGAIS